MIFGVFGMGKLIFVKFLIENIDVIFIECLKDIYYFYSFW